MRVKFMQDRIDILRLKKTLWAEENGYKVINLLGFKFRKQINLIKYWEQRAEKYQARAVGDISKNEDGITKVIEIQEQLFSSALKSVNISKVDVAIDFGCGVGRFENFLLKIAKRKIYALGVTKKLLELASTFDKVEYIHINNPPLIPLENNIADFVFIKSVFGGIIDNNILKNTIKELVRISKDSSIFFLFEGTQKTNVAHWCGRNVQEYKNLFNQVITISFNGGGGE